MSGYVAPFKSRRVSSKECDARKHRVLDRTSADLAGPLASSQIAAVHYCISNPANFLVRCQY